MSVARQAKLWQWAAVAYTLAASIFFAFMPLIPVSNGGPPSWVQPIRLLGWGVFLPLLLPLAVALLPLVLPWRRLLVAWISTGLLVLICLGLALSSGLLFLPTPLFAAVGAYLTGRAPIEDTEVEDRPWRVPDA